MKHGCSSSCNSSEKCHVCELCSKPFKSKQSVTRHLNSGLHMKMLALVYHLIPIASYSHCPSVCSGSATSPTAPAPLPPGVPQGSPISRFICANSPSLFTKHTYFCLIIIRSLGLKPLVCDACGYATGDPSRMFRHHCPARNGQCPAPKRSGTRRTPYTASRPGARRARKSPSTGSADPSPLCFPGDPPENTPKTMLPPAVTDFTVDNAALFPSCSDLSFESLLSRITDPLQSALPWDSCENVYPLFSEWAIGTEWSSTTA